MAMHTWRKPAKRRLTHFSHSLVWWTVSTAAGTEPSISWSTPEYNDLINMNTK